MGLSNMSTAGIALVLALLIGGAFGRPVRFSDGIDGMFICPKDGVADFACVETDWKIGTAISDELQGGRLRKLLQQYVYSSSRGNSWPTYSQPTYSRYSSRPTYSSQPSYSTQTSYQDLFGSSNPSYSTSSSGYPTSGSQSTGSTPYNPGSSTGCSDTDSSAAAVAACTNAVRMNPGAYSYPCSTYWMSEVSGSHGPLSINGALTSAAQRQSNYQASIGRMTHSGPGGSSLRSQVSGAGYGGSAIAQNVAYGQRSAKDVVMSWMCSAGHRRNMMSCKYSDLGVGVDCSSGRCYYTQNFGCSGSCGCSGRNGGTSSSRDSVYSSAGYGQQPTTSYPSYLSQSTGYTQRPQSSPHTYYIRG